MKHYFLSGLSDQQKTSLSDSLVVLSEMVLDGKSGLLLDETNKEFALKVLGATVESQKPTAYDGIFELVISIVAAAKDGANAQANSGVKSDSVVAQPKPVKPALDAEHQRYRELYIAACSTRVSELVVQNRQVIVGQRQEIERLQLDLVRELRALRLEKGRTTGEGVIDRDAFMREFDAIFQVPKVKDVRVEDGVISVFTEMLIAEDPRDGKRHEVGEFLIQFLTDGQADCVRWYNLTRRVNAGRDQQQAPHVFQSGRSCLNVLKESLIDLVAELQFAVATQLAIDFIEQVDVEEPDGALIDRRPAERRQSETENSAPAGL